MFVKKIYKKLIPEKQRIDLLYVLFKVRAIFYYGNNYTCNCCGKSFRKFLSYGNIPRVNAACPYCNSLERNRVLWFYLQDELAIDSPAKLKILHFAPERILSENLKKIPGLEYISADVNPALAEYRVDVTNINFSDNYFDIIICSHVLGHVHDELKAVEEMFRVLRPGGKAIVMTLINQKSDFTLEDAQIKTAAERLKHYGEPDLMRLHGLDFAGRLKKTKFCVSQIDYAKKLGENYKSTYSLGNGDRELIFECIKQC